MCLAVKQRVFTSMSPIARSSARIAISTRTQRKNPKRWNDTHAPSSRKSQYFPTKRSTRSTLGAEHQVFSLQSSLQKILTTIQNGLDVAANAEVTLEINPETVSLENAKAWRDLGFNRASLGVQTLNGQALARLKRSHTPKDARKALEVLRAVGFSNISADFIFGLEGQTVQEWESTLHEILAWDLDHISAYNLIIEEKTRFAVELRQGTLRLPDEESQVRMFRRTRQILSGAGFTPYEISNYAKPGFESRHNLIYWTGGNYYGVGTAAHSFRKRDHLKIQRWWNCKNLPKYVELIENGGDPKEDSEELRPRNISVSVS